MTKTMHPQPQSPFDPPGCGKSTLRHIVAGTLSQFGAGSLMNVKKIVHGVMVMAKCRRHQGRQMTADKIDCFIHRLYLCGIPHPYPGAA
jgi:hypothetical protein